MESSRCPGCGRDVSTLARACTNCGWLLRPQAFTSPMEPAAAQVASEGPVRPGPDVRPEDAEAKSTPRGSFSLTLTLMLVIVGAAVAGVVLLRPSKAAAVTLSTAGFVPADAAVYVAMNTDLSSTQWLQADNLATRLGRTDPQQDLRNAVHEQGDVDWQSEVTPFLGGDIAIYLSGLDSSGSVPQGAAIARCTDAGRAMAVLEAKIGGDLQAGTYEGVPYRYDSGHSIYLARLSDYVVVANNQDSLFTVFDVRASRRQALASVPDFKSLRAELMPSFLAFAYVNSAPLLNAAMQSNVVGLAPAGLEQVQQELHDAASSGLTPGPAAFAVATRKGAIELQSALAGAGGRSLPLLQPRDSHFVKLAPAGTEVFSSAGGLAQTVDQVVQHNQGQIDGALRQVGYEGGLDGLLQQGESQLGLKSLPDAINLFSGEIALAAGFPAPPNSGPQAVLLADVNDTAQARQLLQTVLSVAGLTGLRTEKAGATDITIATGDDGTELAYALTDGYLALGTASSLRGFLTWQGPSLADTDNYQGTVAQMPDRLGTFGYVDVAALVRHSGQDSGQLGGVEAHLRGVIINLVSIGNVSRLSAVLTSDR